MKGQAGQASVELVAVLPVAVAVAAGLLCALTAGAASQAASSAAEAGALAVLQDRDPVAAARRTLAPRMRSVASITVDGGVVRVRVRPDVPVGALARALEGSATAHAGRRGSVPVESPRGGDGASGSAR